jgi:hypothetical protein
MVTPATARPAPRVSPLVTEAAGEPQQPELPLQAADISTLQAAYASAPDTFRIRQVD